MAANGTPIRAFGKSQREIKIGGISYSFVFIIAQVLRPILGLDFLQTFKMAIDLGNRRLLHLGAATAFTSVASDHFGCQRGTNLTLFVGTSSPRFSGNYRCGVSISDVLAWRRMLYQHDRATCQDASKGFVSGEVAGCKKILRHDVCRGDL